MKETNTKHNYRADHSQFGGNIDPEDFSTVFPNKKRITNQINAVHISDQRKKEEMYRRMTLEEFREMRIVSNTNGRPASTLTDEKWQTEFQVRKMFIIPYNRKVKLLRGQYTKESGKWNEEIQGTYHGQTNWQEYCAYINNVLRNIRSGQVDYCYYIFQIMDLLKFHLEDLKTKYCDGYWEVWLESQTKEDRKY